MAGSDSTAPPNLATTYTPIIYVFALIICGYALSWVRLQHLTHKNIVGPLYLAVIVALMYICFVQAVRWPYLSQLSPGGLEAVVIIYLLCDMVSIAGLNILYILRLLACTRMYKFHNFWCLLFIFPALYAVGDILGLAQVLDPNAFPFSQAELGSAVGFLIVTGNVVAQLSTITILLRGLGNLKDPREKRNLKILAVEKEALIGWE